MSRVCVATLSFSKFFSLHCVGPVQEMLIFLEMNSFGNGDSNQNQSAVFGT